MKTAIRIIVGIAIAPLVAALALAALLGYGALCAADFLPRGKSKNE